MAGTTIEANQTILTNWAFQPMSKKLQKKAGKLVRKAEDRATTIRRVVMEYTNAAEISNVTDYTKQHEIERAVVKYNEVHKAIKRLRRKMDMKKSQQLPTASIRQGKLSRAK